MNLLKEIASKLPDLGPQAISIVEKESNNPKQTDYRILLKGVSIDSVQQIKIIAQNHSLAVLDNKIDLAIYSPVKEE